MTTALFKPARSLIAANPRRRLLSLSALRMSDQDKSALDAKHGSVGSAFQPDGKVGKTAEEVGGEPFQRDGTIGKEFTESGKVGGAAQVAAGLGNTQIFRKTKTGVRSLDGQSNTAVLVYAGADQMQGKKPGMFDKDGAVGRQFETGGSLASTAEAVGGPFAADGVIGKQFTSKGAVGGTVQENLGDKK